MHAHGPGNRSALSRLGRLKAWGRDHLPALVPAFREALWEDFSDTLRRLLRGDFRDLTEGERRARVEQIIGLSSSAAMAMAAAPIPLLELPVQAAMVSAVARVYGRPRSGRRALWEVGAALGGGVVVRQAMRLLPFVGPLPHLSRVYGATWALGRAAQLYYQPDAGASEASTPADLRQVFTETARSQTEAQSRRLTRADVTRALRNLDDQRVRAAITEAEYRRRRDEIVERL